MFYSSFLWSMELLLFNYFQIPFNRTAAGDGYSVLTFTPWSVLLFILVLFVIASLSFSFMVSVFFTRGTSLFKSYHVFIFIYSVVMYMYFLSSTRRI